MESTEKLMLRLFAEDCDDNMKNLINSVIDELGQTKALLATTQKRLDDANHRISSNSLVEALSVRRDERLHIAIEALQKIRMRTRLIAGSGAVAGAALEKIKDLGVGDE